MSEQKIQSEQFEKKYKFREVDPIDFNEALHFLKKELKLIHYNNIVYFKVLPNGRVVAKKDLALKKSYLT